MAQHWIATRPGGLDVFSFETYDVTAAQHGEVSISVRAAGTNPAIKGDHTIIGHADEIPIPPQSERTTAKGELGLIIGRQCRNVSEEDALDHVFGVTTILDQTAEDILQRNPRFPDPVEELPGLPLLRP